MSKRSEAVEQNAVHYAAPVYRAVPAGTAPSDVPLGYKRTAVGVIPKDWGVTRLGDLGTFLKGNGVTRDQAQSGYLPCIRYGEIYTVHNEHIRAFFSWISPAIASTATRLHSGDLLFAGSGETKEEIGKCVAFLEDIEAFAGGDIVILRPVGVDSNFLGYALNSPRVNRQKSRWGQGDAVVHISARALAQVSFPVPPRNEQRAIAAALSDADALIESLDRLIAKKRAIKQATMQQLLTGQTRLPGFTGEWETKRLGDIASFHKGSGLSKAELLTDGTNPCIHYGELFTQYGERIVDVKSRTNHQSGCLKSLPNDVLMPTSDVTPNGLATASCVTRRNVILGGDVLVIRCNDSVMDGTFLAYKIRMDHRQIMQLVSGTTVFHIYGRDMANFMYYAPTVDEQRAIVSILTDMDVDIEALERRRNKARLLKKGMMQQLLTGRIRFVEASKQEEVAV